MTSKLNSLKILNTDITITSAVRLTFKALFRPMSVYSAHPVLTHALQKSITLSVMPTKMGSFERHQNTLIKLTLLIRMP